MEYKGKSEVKDKETRQNSSENIYSESISIYNFIASERQVAVHANMSFQMGNHKVMVLEHGLKVTDHLEAV